MVLEATMIIIDNSESSRNGDYQPTRFEAQADAVSLIFSAKTQANPESSVGLMTMGGDSPEVLVTLTTDIGKMLAALHTTKIKGGISISTALQVAQLALKHRSNKGQQQRIIAFVCSPILEDEKSLVKLAKKMKKNNIAVDFVNFGEQAENTLKLEAFINAINSSDNSRLATIPAGPGLLLSDALISTPILGDGTSGGAGGGGADSSQFEFGVDPTMDPELALALRMSMEDEKARQEREKAKQEAESSNKPLEGIKEEDENTPLLQENKGEGSGSGSGSGAAKDKKDDDKMDTA